MNSRALITMMALAIGLAALTGCSDNSNELQRLVCEVESVNEGSPLISAARDQDGVIPIDNVSVVFRARPLTNNIYVPNDGAYSSFIITSYDLIWSSTDPHAPAGLADFNITSGLVSVQVPINDKAEVFVLIAPAEMKTADWFGGAAPFSASAQLIFKGHVSGTDHEVDILGGLTVNFIDVIVE